MKLSNQLAFDVMLFVILFFPSVSNAALISRDLDGNLSTVEAYYDNEADLTWLKNSIGPGFVVNYSAADAWVTGLDFNGVTNWRLPTTLQPDPGCSNQQYGLSYGYNCSGSELGNMFYNVFGGQAGQPISLINNTNNDLFFGIQDSIFYWSSTDDQVIGKWAFLFGDGYQGAFTTGASLLAWAVHDGDVGSAVVPSPSAIWLFGSGFIGLIGIAKRKSA